MEYVVIIVHSFDFDTPVYKFGDDYKKAKKYLQKKWKEYYDEEKRCGSQLNEEFCFYEDEYGKIEWKDGETTEFILSFISNPVD